MPTAARIKYKNKGFWIPEEFIEVLSQYVCEAFERIGVDTFSPNLKKVYISCDANRGGSAIGMVGIPLDRYILNSDDKKALISVLQDTKTLVLSKGVELSIPVLNQFEFNKIDIAFANEWHYPIKTQSLASTIDIVGQLLNETWASSSHSVYFAGFPKPDNVTEI